MHPSEKHAQPPGLCFLPFDEGGVGGESKRKEDRSRPLVLVLSALRTDAMPTIDIRGTSVAFPFKPYDCQLKYIGGVLEALDDSVRQFLKFSLSLRPAPARLFPGALACKRAPDSTLQKRHRRRPSAASPCVSYGRSSFRGCFWLDAVAWCERCCTTVLHQRQQRSDKNAESEFVLAARVLGT